MPFASPSGACGIGACTDVDGTVLATLPGSEPRRVHAMLEAALAVVRDGRAGGGLLAVAVVTLSTAAREGLPLPDETPRLLWDAIIDSPGATWAGDAADVVGGLADGLLVETIILTIASPDAGRDLTRIALSALADPAAAALVTDPQLLRLAERVEGRAVIELANVVVVVSETRRVDDAVLDEIAARWTASPDPSVRCAALELHALRGWRSVEAVEGLLVRDPSPRVRAATAVRIGELLDPDVALALVGHALELEATREVIVDLLRAQADLVAMATLRDA